VDGEANAYALDSYAILSYLEGEEGSSRVKEILRRAEAGSCRLYLSLINLGEVLYITERENNLAAAQRVLAAIDQLPVLVVPCSRETVLAAAHIKARYPISYADAFAAVTALDNGCVLLTGDPEFRSLAKENLIDVEWL